MECSHGLLLLNLLCPSRDEGERDCGELMGAMHLRAAQEKHLTRTAHTRTVTYEHCITLSHALCKLTSAIVPMCC